MTTGSGRRTARSRVKSSVTDDDQHFKSGNSKRKGGRSSRNDSRSIGNLDVNLKVLLGFGILAFSIALFFIYRLVHFTGEVDDNSILRIVTPFPSPKLADLPMVCYAIPCYSLSLFTFLSHTNTTFLTI